MNIQTPPSARAQSGPCAACACARETDAQKRERIVQVVDTFRHQPGSLIQILHLVQGIYGYLPLDIQQLVAERLDVPLSEVYGVTTFYSYFSTKPRGEYAWAQLVMCAAPQTSSSA